MITVFKYLKAIIWKRERDLFGVEPEEKIKVKSGSYKKTEVGLNKGQHTVAVGVTGRANVWPGDAGGPLDLEVFKQRGILSRVSPHVLLEERSCFSGLHTVPGMYTAGTQCLSSGLMMANHRAESRVK